MDYSFFDALIDSVFVINSERGIVYCNESAAKLCESSVRRLSKGKPIYDSIEFGDETLYVMPNGITGKDAPAPYTEIEYKLKSGKNGKVQVAIQPFLEAGGEPRWAVMIRDVTLEEVLHAKYHKQLEQLEAYSKNLEHMVEERTQEVKRANTMLNAIMNSLGQGFFVFDQNGDCADFFTRACEDVLEGKPSGRKVHDVLRVPESEMQTFQMWMDSSFKEMLPFDSLKELGPKTFPHSQDHRIQLEYYPLRNDAGNIERIVVVATDQTAQHVAQEALEREKRFARMVVKLVTSKRQFAEFISSAKGTIEQVLKMAKSATEDQFDYQHYFRILHTLEGEAATYSVTDVWQASRVCQQVIEPLKRGEKVEWMSLKKAFTSSLEDMRKALAEFLEINKDLFKLVGLGAERTVEISHDKIDEILATLRRRNISEAICADIEGMLLKEPISLALRHYDDVVKIIAEKLNKKVAPIEFKGQEVRVFMENYTALFSTFVHAFRNIVDHGIESPEERKMLGKPEIGHICVHTEYYSAKNGSNWIRITIQDDGSGISIDKLRQKIAQTEPHTDSAGLSDSEVAQYVFSSGISTKEEVGEFSGRGIGMNAIKAEAQNLGGTASVENYPGLGVKLIVEVPDLNRIASIRQSA